MNLSRNYIALIGLFIYTSQLDLSTNDIILILDLATTFHTNVDVFITSRKTLTCITKF